MSGEEEYPEHEKMSKIAEHSQRIGEMIDDMQIVVCKVDDFGKIYSAGSVLDQMALLFDIDLEKLEDEKQIMLAKLQGES